MNIPPSTNSVSTPSKSIQSRGQCRGLYGASEEAGAGLGLGWGRAGAALPGDCRGVGQVHAQSGKRRGRDGKAYSYTTMSSVWVQAACQGGRHNYMTIAVTATVTSTTLTTITSTTITTLFTILIATLLTIPITTLIAISQT